MLCGDHPQNERMQVNEEMGTSVCFPAEMILGVHASCKLLCGQLRLSLQWKPYTCYEKG